MQNKIKELFNHVDSLKKVVLVTTGRTGSDFFQSLLEDHSEILQISGAFFFHQFWEKAVCKDNINDLINEFIWFNDTISHITKFKSFYNTFERWDQLGNNKNEFFEVDIELFRNYMIDIFSNIDLNRKNFFIAIHLAYNLAINKDIKKCKILFYHIHHIEKLEQFILDFTNFDVVCSIREPRNTIVSGLENHAKFGDINTMQSKYISAIYKRVFEESEFIKKYTNNFYTLKLEDIHLSSKKLMHAFCNKYNLTYESTMLESTYHLKQWWGDKSSGKYLKGFNKNIAKKNWEGKFYFYENFVFEFIMKDRLEYYNYPVVSKFKSLVFIPLVVVMILFPLKYEIIILKQNTIKVSNIATKLRNILFFGLHYGLRIKLFYKYLIKKIKKEIYLSDNLTVEKV